MVNKRIRETDAKTRQIEAQIAAASAAEVQRITAQSAADETRITGVTEMFERVLDKLAQLPQPTQEGFLQLLRENPELWLKREEQPPHE